MKRRLFGAAWAALLLFVFSIQPLAARMLVPVGKVVGLSLAEGSVTVVAFDDTLGGAARDCGLQIGDDIMTIDGKNIDSASELQDALKRSDGTVELTVNRRDQQHRLKLSPAVTGDGPKLGVYIREGITGIGTVTYYDPDSGTFGALGHGVSTAAGEVAAMKTGSVYRASVVGVRPGQAGAPGQLQGAVSAGEVIGSLRVNCGCGVFGSCEKFSGEPLPVAEKGEVTTGPAQILSNISGDEVECFSVEILKIHDAPGTQGRNLLLQVTDPNLLQKTGGIVAGMSGSPILQDGRIVGAVTHVLVNDPTMGYGIFIENMLDAAG